MTLQIYLSTNAHGGVSTFIEVDDIGPLPTGRGFRIEQDGTTEGYLTLDPEITFMGVAAKVLNYLVEAGL